MFTWDYEDRLTNLSGGGVPSTNYGYNGAGSRTSKSNTAGSRTYKRNGVGVTAPVLADGVATMVPGISEKTGGQTNFMHTDRMGSMKGMSNAGAVTETAEFDAFGKVTSRTNPSTTQKGFASGFGYQEDGESGYKLLGHRYYDPETGRFLSQDPIGDGRNWYVYCANNPLKYVDADGLMTSLQGGGGMATYEAVSPGVSASIAARHASMIPEWLRRLMALGRALAARAGIMEAEAEAQTESKEPERLRKGKEAHKERLDPLKGRDDLDVEKGIRDKDTGKLKRPDTVGNAEGNSKATNEQDGVIVHEVKPLGCDMARALRQMLDYVEILEKSGIPVKGLSLDLYSFRGANSLPKIRAGSGGRKSI